ncbi:MAG: PKD domain-containing protein [Bacteroidales bacterium]|nr:PKD domain-containing protein [Bacteroidales bacterium]
MYQKINSIKIIPLIILLSLFFNSPVFSQCDTCDNTITFYVDLTASPDSTWISPETNRDGVCCDNAGLRCLRFIVYTHPSTDQISFNIATPPIPPGQFYQYDCGPYVSAGEPLCISGAGPHCIVYCKPGADISAYSITVSETVEAGPDIGVADGCTGMIWSSGLDESSILWNSIFPGAYGEYNYFLDCAAGCDTAHVIAQPGFPPFIDFEVSGAMLGPCSMFNTSDTVRVYFYDEKWVDIEPDSAVVCFGASSAVLTATPVGGNPPYEYLWNTGETTQSVSVGLGTYIVAVTDQTDCPPVYDTVVVTQHLAPITANAGADQLLCSNNADVNLNGSIGTATGGIWSGGTGTFSPNATTLNATYTPTAAEISSGFLSLFLTTTGNSGCPPVTDVINVTFMDEPIVTVSPDQTVCANNSVVNVSGTILNATQGIWTSSGTGNFAPSTTDWNVIYTPSNADTANGFVSLTFTSTDGCADISDQMILTILPAPFVNAGDDRLVCETDPGVALSGIISGGTATGLWTSSGTGNFSPSATNLNATYNFSAADIAAGSVTITLTSTNNGNCNPVSDQILVTILDVPIANAGSDLLICNFDPVPLNGIITGGSGTGIWTTPDGTGSFSPDHTYLDAVYYPSNDDYAAGSFTLVLTSTNNGTCNPAFDNILVTVEPSPMVFAGPNQIVCANNAAVNLFGNVSNGASNGIWTSSGTGMFLPSNTDLNAIYYPSEADTAAGFVTLTLTSTDGCETISDNMNITINPGPYVNGNGDYFICFGDTLVDISGTISVGASTGIWTSMGTGYFLPDDELLTTSYIMSPDDLANGGVELILTSTNNGNCLPVSDNVQVSITTIPSVDAGPDQTICGNMTASISGSITDGAGTGIWSTPDGTGYFLPDATSLNATYVPSDADTAAGQVNLVLTATDACEPNSDFLVLTILDGPYVNAGSDQIVCQDAPNVSLNGEISLWAQPGQWTSSGTGTFTPNSFTLNATYNPSAADIAAGEVFLTLISTNNGICDAGNDQIHITILPPPIANAGGNQTVCANNSTAINGSITGGSGLGIWTTSGDGSFLNSDSTIINQYMPGPSDISSGSVTLTLTSINNGGCFPAVDNAIITIQPAPSVNAGSDLFACSNNPTVNLSGSVTIATGGVWSSLGGGWFFPDAGNLNAQFTASAADVANGSVSLVLSSTGNGLCLPVSDTMRIVFTPSPVVNAGTDIYVCEGTTTASLSGSVSGPTVTGVWSTLGSGSFFPSSTFLHSTYNLSSADLSNGWVDLVLTSTGNGNCLPVTDTVRVIVTEIPAVNAGPDQVVCANNSATLLNGVVFGTPGTGQWSTPNGTGSFSPSETSFTTTYYPGINDAALGDVIIIFTATDACVPVRDTLILTITPSPIVNAGPDQLICDNITSVQLNGTVSAGASQGLWTTTNGTGSFVPNANALNAVYNLSAGDIDNEIVTLVLTSTNNGDCFPVSDTMRISFGVNPIAGFDFPAVVCLNAPTVFTNTSTISEGSIVFHQWNFGSNVYYTEDVTHTFTFPGIYDIQLTEYSNIGCSDAITQQVTVLPPPVADFLYSPDCADDLVAFTDNSTPAASWLWVFGNGNTSTSQTPINQTYPMAGDYEVSLSITDANGCSAQKFDTITIFPRPTAAMLLSGYCAGELLGFNDMSVISDDTIISWTWDFGDGFTSNEQNPFHLYANEGNYNLILEVSTANCTDADTQLIYINPIPVIDISPSATDGCNYTNVVFTNNTTGASSYFWDFGDGVTSVVPSPNHTFINNTNLEMVFPVTVVAISPEGCRDTLHIDITIHPSPVAAISSNSTPGCSPLLVDFENFSADADNYLWNFGDGNTSTEISPQHTFINDTSFILYYNVVLTAYSAFGCADSINQFVTVFPNPDYDFTVTPDSSCNPSLVQLTTIPGEYSYEWIYGDGTSELAGANAWHMYSSTSLFDTTYTVELVTTTFFGCKDTVSHDLVIHPSPVANYSVDTLEGCTPLVVEITNNSFGANSYTWNYGDGTSSTNSSPIFSHTFENPGLSPVSYNCQLIAESDNGCTSVMTKTITVFPASHSGFYVSAEFGCSPLEVHFTNSSMGTDAYNWYFGDGNSSTNTNPVHTFVNNGLDAETVNVLLVSSSIYGCKDTATFPITIYPKPDASFALAASSGCSPFNAVITNNSVGASSYYWDFGDGTNSTSVGPTFNHTYENLTGLLQTVNIQLNVTNNFGCIDQVLQTVNVFPEVMADFSVETEGCSPYTVTFVNQSMGSVSYTWVFGDGNVSTSSGPTHTYVNNSLNDTVFTPYLVTLSTFGCPDTAYMDINVLAQPKPIFEISESSGCSPLTVDITNNSLGVSTYLWDFDDGTSSNTDAAAFSHVFVNTTLNPVTYVMELEVTGASGCVKTVFESITVYPEVYPYVICDTVGCHPLSITFNNFTTGASTYSWNFGDGGTSNDSVPTHTYFNPSAENVMISNATMLATSSFGCVDSVSFNINTYPTPNTVFSINQITGCSPFNAIIENNTQGGEDFYWNYGDGVLDNNSSEIIHHTYENYSGSTSTYNLELLAINQYGCEDHHAQYVTIYPDVSAGFVALNEGCSPLPVNFINMSEGAETYYWHFGDGASSGEVNPSHTYTNYTNTDVTYNMGLVATSEYGCQDTFIYHVTVFATPLASFTATPTFQVYPSTIVDIVNQTTGIWDYYWTFGDGQETSNANPWTHDYDTWGTYQITLFASGENCSDSISHTVIIDAPPPQAAFEPNASGCAPFHVIFENQTLYGTSFYWNFGDGGSSTMEHPSYTYHHPGVYIVSLKVIGYHGEEVLAEDRVITVYDKPLAYFKPIPAVVSIPNEMVTFFNLSENVEHSYWDFGDGTTDTVFQPTHYYVLEGSYDVYLHVTSPDGCVDSVLLNDAVLAQSDCQVIFPNAFSPAGAKMGENKKFRPIYKGITDYRLEIFNRWGELIFVSTNPDYGWDGYYREELCKQDVYVWKATYICANGEKFVKTGDCTLLR